MLAIVPQSNSGRPAFDRYVYHAAVADNLWKNHLWDLIRTLLHVLLRLAELVRTRLAK